MSNRRPPWQIPAVINPPNRRCIRIDVPDDPEHISILWGVLRGLSDWQRWQQEPTHSATLVAQVWREVVYSIDWGRMSCCPEPTNQYYDANGILQVSYDGGLTYEPATNDPRNNAPLLPPLTSDVGDDRKCEAANNVVGYLKAAADKIIADASLWGEISGLLSAILAILVVIGIIGSGGALTPLMLALAAALLATGRAGFDAAMTGDVYDTLLRIVYCNTPDDGVYTQENWQAIKSQILGQLSGIAATFLHDNVNALGVAGITNASRVGQSAGLDCSGLVCSECPCDLFSWNWSPDYGTPEDAVFTRTESACSLTAENVYHDSGTGFYYYGVYAPTGCTVAAGIVSGSVNIFHGYIPSGHTEDYSWFDVSEDWVSGAIPGANNAKAIIMISTVPFTPYAQLV